MALNRQPKQSESGIALFMVIAAMTVLSLIVTEFTYITQVNQRMAFDSLDQIKAFYLAKSGLKLQLLRLKAYQNVKGALSGSTKAAGVPSVPQQVLNKIWNFPFMYPFPTNLPGMTLGDKERIEKFQSESGLDGSFTAMISSESSKFNLNSILSSFASKPQPNPSSTPTPAASSIPFDPESARNSLGDHLYQILDQKFQADPDFANEYRDLKLEDLTLNIAQWADRTYEPPSSSSRKQIKPKKAPFYSLSELHMIYPIDDRLFELFAPELTVSTTPGINVNTLQEATLRALLPKITKDESDEFFKHRDSEEEDGQFLTEEDFFQFIKKSVKGYQSDDGINDLKKDLAKRHIQIVTDESNFKITVRSQVNQATRLIEAWVTLSPLKKQASSNPVNPPTLGNNSSPGEGTTVQPDTGLKITYMRTQ